MVCFLRKNESDAVRNSYVDDEAEGEGDEGCETTWEGYGVAGISDRDVYRADQEAYWPPQEEQERLSFSPRIAQDGFEAQALDGLSAENRWEIRKIIGKKAQTCVDFPPALCIQGAGLAFYKFFYGEI